MALFILFIFIISCLSQVRSLNEAQYALNITLPLGLDNIELPMGNKSSVVLDDFFIDFRRRLDDQDSLPPSSTVLYFDETSEAVQDAIFYAKLTRTSNCRPSYDKLNCPFCKEILPDGYVVQTYGNNPLGITGYIAVSEQKKSIYVLVRGASSFRNKIVFGKDELVPHPFIPRARAQIGLIRAMLDIRDTIHQAVSDQIGLHPDYKVHVAGHSFGAGVGSLVTVDLYQHFPQLNFNNLQGHLLESGKPRVGDIGYASFVADQNINITRYVQEDDEIVHRPTIKKGFTHEGDEYWISSRKRMNLIVCPGPRETRNCSNSLEYGGSMAHLSYFGIVQSCDDDLHNLI